MVLNSFKFAKDGRFLLLLGTQGHPVFCLNVFQPQLTHECSGLSAVQLLLHELSISKFVSHVNRIFMHFVYHLLHFFFSVLVPTFLTRLLCIFRFTKIAVPSVDPK